MKTIGHCVLAAALCIPQHALAQDNRQRDTGGVLMDRTAWHDIASDEFMLNIVDLPDASTYGAQRRFRDNRATQERIRFDAGKGFVFVEHFHVGHYNENVTNLFKSTEFTRKFAERFWRSAKEGFTVEDRRKVYRFGDRSGWLLVTRGSENGRVCLIGRVAFLSDGSKAARVLYEVYDTGMSYRDCSRKRSLDDVARWLEGVKIVEQPYNRVR